MNTSVPRPGLGYMRRIESKNPVGKSFLWSVMAASPMYDPPLPVPTHRASWSGRDKSSPWRKEELQVHQLASLSDPEHLISRISTAHAVAGPSSRWLRSPAVEVHSNADTEPNVRYLRASGGPELIHDTVRARHTLSCEETARTRL